MMIDLVFLAHGRREFTRASFAALQANTNWRLVQRLVIYTDGDYTDPDYLGERFPNGGPESCHVIGNLFGGPVAIMNNVLDYLDHEPVFAKIDNDVIVPPGWLDRCVAVMEAFPELDLLGIEPPRSRTPSKPAGRRMAAPELDGPVVVAGGGGDRLNRPGWPVGASVGYGITESIGGVGLMRRAAWGAERMTVSGFRGVGGFTGWQLERPKVKKGWIAPPLDLFLLDRLPIEPWKSLSDRYISEGMQRPWTRYDSADSSLWDWWVKSEGCRSSSNNGPIAPDR